MSNAVNSIGIRFRRWDITETSSGESWDDIAEITGFSLDKSREMIKVTSLDSTDGYDEFIPSFRNSGEPTMPMNFIRTNYDLLNSDFESDTIHYYSIILTDTAETELEFAGYVSGLKVAGSVGSQITAEVTIKITGKVTVSSGASSGI
jgi:hypothetical protein